MSSGIDDDCQADSINKILKDLNPMSKALVICIDGTWNTPGQTDTDPTTHQEAITKTNVAKTWEALTQQELPDNRPYGRIGDLALQNGEALYLNGVGSTGNKLEEDFDGSTGDGTATRIRDAYRFIAERWEAGDSIFAFGFSRGAFAVRSALGFLNHVGLPAQRAIIKEDELDALYRCYKNKGAAPSWTRKDARVDFLGVWETVGALAFESTFNNYHELNPDNVNSVRQALALDEIRKQFLPEYWQQKNHCDYRETWFAGAHSNIGGGYVDANLSNIALFWMLQHAQTKGLQLQLEKIDGWQQENPDGEIRNSYQEFWSANFLGKWIEKFNAEQKIRTLQTDQFIHESVFVAAQTGYTPKATFENGNSALTGTQEAWIKSN